MYNANILLFNFLKKENFFLLKNKNNSFFKNKKILITGSSGLIGVNLLIFFFLLSKTSNSPKKITSLYKTSIPKFLKYIKINKKFKFIQCDLSKELSDKINSKFDIIFHCAGYAQPAKFISDPIATMRLNSFAIHNLLKRIAFKGNFVFLSSSEVYSGLEGIVSEDRTGLTTTSHKRACYIEGKKYGETLLQAYKNKLKLNLKIIRLCLAYGPGARINDTRVMSQFIDQLIKRKNIKMIDDGKAIRSYIFISDVIKIMLNIIIKGKDNIYNIGGKEKISIFDLAKKISKYFNNAKVYKKILAKKNFSAPKNAFVSIKKYENELGKIKLIKIDNGLEKTIKWHKLLYEK